MPKKLRCPKKGRKRVRPYVNGSDHRLARSQVRKRSPHFVLRLIEITSRQQQAQRTLLDWLRMEYAIEKPSNKLLACGAVGGCRKRPEQEQVSH